jgi:hypothetical protein
MWFLGFLLNFTFFSLIYRFIRLYALASAYIQRLHPTPQKSCKRLHKRLFFYRDRLEALPGLIRPPRRKPKCDRTATRRHDLLPLDIWMPPIATCCHWTWLDATGQWQVLKSHWPESPMIGQRQGVKILCDKFDGLTPCMGHWIGGLIGNGGNFQS